MKLTVLGAGAWGTALAARAALRHPTTLWARDAAQVAALRNARENARYLPGVALPQALQIESDFDAALSDNIDDNLVIVATPMAALREMLQRLNARAAPSSAHTRVLWLCKGFEQGSGLLGHEIAREVAPSLAVGVLSGPSFALEVARGQPTALVAASADAALCASAVDALHSESLRIYSSNDAIGVEVGGAVKNVLAIATGIADGMPLQKASAQTVPSTSGLAKGLASLLGAPNPSSRDQAGLGLNARAALVTRGLAEMTRLGIALGARSETFMGLSGLGDLVLTATGDLSRNRSVGKLLAQGLPLARILAELGHVAEGVSTAPMVLSRAAALGVDMPITQAVVAVLDGALTPMQALESLMGRQSTSELDA